MAELGDSAGSHLKVSPPELLRADHDLSSFDCGDEALNSWLKLRAINNDSRFSRTYVVCQGSAVIGYYCISAGSVERSAVPGRIRRNAPEKVPVSIIGRLAVHRSFIGRGLGSGLLSDALGRIAAASQSIGIAAVLIQAKDDRARDFYLGCAEFLEFPTESRALFLPIETVVAAFS